MSRPLANFLSRVRDHRGIALISVLWVLTLLSLIAASFMRTTRTEINLAYNLVENAKAEALADAGVHRVMWSLLQPYENGGWQIDGTPYVWRYNGGQVVISVQDEYGKIDLNRADATALRGLLSAIDLPLPEGGAAKLSLDEIDALTDAILDFRDPDDLTRLNGAEDADYRAAGLEWDAKDGFFASETELYQVIGMTPAIYEAIRPAVTVHSRRARINANTAPELVRRALDIEPSIASELTLEGEESPGPLEELLDIPEGAEPEPADPFLTEVQRRQGVGTPPQSRAELVSIRAEAKTENGSVFVREAVVRLLKGRPIPYQVKSWGQGLAKYKLPSGD